MRARLPTGVAPFPGAEVDFLRNSLMDQVKVLDYQLLNDHVEQPTDENVARWIRSRMNLPVIESIGVHSTRDEGVDLDSRDHAHVWRRYRFEAAHRLPNVPAGHKCGRMHGHGFEIVLHANQSLGLREISIDYDEIDKLWAPICDDLHFNCLNDIPGLTNPTSELIASWIWHRLKPALPELSFVTVYETETCGAHFDGNGYRIWKDLSLDSALRLRRAPDGDPRRRIYGHTYTLRLHLTAALDEVLGWTVDFGDVKELFAPIFKSLDHQPLYELEGADDNDAATLIRYIRQQCGERLPALNGIDLYETKGCGALLSWGNGSPAIPT